MLLQVKCKKCNKSFRWNTGIGKGKEGIAKCGFCHSWLPLSASNVDKKEIKQIVKS